MFFRKKKVEHSQESQLERIAIEIKQKEEAFSSEIKSVPLFPIELHKKDTIKRSVSDIPGVSFYNITRATKIDSLFPLVVIDTETTGISKKNKIIEIAALKYDRDFQLVSRFSTLINPSRHIPEEATQVNHITDEMVADAPSFSEVIDALYSFIQGSNIIGHNLRFDLDFLFLGGFDFPQKVKYIDTLDLAQKILVKDGQKKYNHHSGIYEDVDDYDVSDYSLETLCTYYGIFMPNAHRAEFDCHATAKLLKHLIEEKTA